MSRHVTGLTHARTPARGRGHRTAPARGSPARPATPAPRQTRETDRSGGQNRPRPDKTATRTRTSNRWVAAPARCAKAATRRRRLRIHAGGERGAMRVPCRGWPRANERSGVRASKRRGGTREARTRGGRLRAARAVSELSAPRSSSPFLERSSAQSTGGVLQHGASRLQE